MEAYFGELWFSRLVIQRGLALLYLVAFISAFNQFPALLGEKGLLPIKAFITRMNFKDTPSLFHWRCSDRFVLTIAALGGLLSLACVFGLPEQGPQWLSLTVWLVIWIFYLSIVNVGQRFYSFGWESMLLEAGFIASFLGSAGITPSLIPLLGLRWMLFRTEVGAGLIKLRHDRCWRELTCLYYHYETQPLPNPLSWFFHRFPKRMHRFSVGFSHVVQLGVPFALFAPQPIASIAAGFIILHQLILIISGNYSWLNWLTVVLGFAAVDGNFIRGMLAIDPGVLTPLADWDQVILYLLALMIIVLSYKPVLNLFSKDQLMNFCYNPFHLINTYGAFGSVTKERYELVIAGTSDSEITENSQWLEYEFRAKPGRLDRMPPVVAPYHLRLDWLMWFLPFGVRVTPRRILVTRYETWFMRFMEKLLEGDKKTLRLLKGNPFANKPPEYIRAKFYRYRYTSWKEWRQTKNWWQREYLGDYLAPFSLKPQDL